MRLGPKDPFRSPRAATLPIGPRATYREGMDIGEARLVGRAELDLLMAALRRRGYRTLGPVVRSGAVVHGEVETSSDLPVGWHDHQDAGSYRLERGDDPALFGWAVGPASWKSEFFPPRERVWRAQEGIGAGTSAIEELAAEPAPVALFGARPCELAGLAVLDRVFDGGAVVDPGYRSRRRDTFVVVTECGTPAGTCFCSSMGTGPGASDGFDLALTELLDESGHRFVVRTGSAAGAELLDEIDTGTVDDATRAARDAVLSGAEAAMGRTLDTDGIAGLLARNLDHSRWDDVAERCLSCGNCTLVCPTCFCSDVDDVTDLSGTVERHRQWSSCFDLAHSHLHGGAVRPSVRSRYRQWMTHKLSTWWDQFGTSGCVGCGRCIAWCPVGIDITEEAAAIRASDGMAGAVRAPDSDAGAAP